MLTIRRSNQLIQSRTAPFAWDPIFKTLTGKSIALEVRAEDTIYLVKDTFYEKVGMPPHAYRLDFAGKQFDDACTVARYRTERQCTLFFLGMLRGAGKFRITVCFCTRLGWYHASAPHLLRP